MIILSCFGMFSMLFWHKYLFRVLKIISMMVVAQQVFNMKMTGKTPKRSQEIFITAVIFTILTGLINTYLMQPSQMGQKRKLWINFHWVKAITAIIVFNPLLIYLPVSKQMRIDIQFYWLIIILILSPFARYYRQWYAAKEKIKDLEVYSQIRKNR